MKIVRYGQPGDIRFGVLQDGQVRDITSLLPAVPGVFDVDTLARIEQQFDEHAASLPSVPVESVALQSPIPRPSKVICIGLNYSDHAAESGMPAPPEPIVFLKAPNAMCGPYDDLILPPMSSKVDWEIELGVVIGREASYLPDLDAAGSVIAGYCASNDVSERTFQLDRGGQWVKGKSCASFQPTGPWFVTADDVPDPQALDLRLTVNGEPMQVGNTSDMIFSVKYVIWYLSQFMVLEPGDLVNTGTPAGVGMGQTPPRFLAAGDVVELSINGLGTQRQVCREVSRSRSLDGVVAG